MTFRESSTPELRPRASLYRQPKATGTSPTVLSMRLAKTMQQACPHCGAMQPTSTSICLACGAFCPTTKSQIIRCRRCGTRTSSNLRLCPGCGRELQAASPHVIKWIVPLLFVALFLFLIQQWNNLQPLHWTEAQLAVGRAWIIETGKRLDPQITISTLPATVANHNLGQNAQSESSGGESPAPSSNSMKLAQLANVNGATGDGVTSTLLVPMVRIPAGAFVRGNLYGFPDERAEQTIFLDEFYIDQYEVTNRQYADCVRAERCNLPQLLRAVNFVNTDAASELGSNPVTFVTWQDAVNYCAFRNKRLPTEAEWEKAARGPGNTLYPWGKDEPITHTNFNYGVGDVTAVGSFEQDVSGYGVYDMAGNVREWVADWYQWDYYLDAPQENPLGPVGGVTKVLRGGSWNDVEIYVRATSRKNFLPDSFESNLGFRCTASTDQP